MVSCFRVFMRGGLEKWTTSCIPYEYLFRRRLLDTNATDSTRLRRVMRSLLKAGSEGEDATAGEQPSRAGTRRKVHRRVVRMSESIGLSIQLAILSPVASAVMLAARRRIPDRNELLRRGCERSPAPRPRCSRSSGARNVALPARAEQSNDRGTSDWEIVS